MKRKWFSCFYPDQYEDSAYTIDFGEFYKQGYRGIIFDIDNTLVRHGYPADRRVIQFFEKLRMLGMRTCLLSNNKIPRVKPFAHLVGDSPFICDAHKPSPKAYLEAVKRMGLTCSQTLFVGDQIFTDVWGAKKAGIYSILVKPVHPKEEIQIVCKRYLERIVLYFYKRDFESIKDK